MVKYIITTILLVSLDLGTIASGTTIDFEDPLPDGLVPMNTVYSGNPVPASAVVTDQYSDLGIIFTDTVLVKLGSGHAPSGVNGLGNIDSNGDLDYGTPMTFTFVSPTDSAIAATTDTFSVTTDLWGGSPHDIVISGFAFDGALLDSQVYTGDPGGEILQLQNIGRIHRVVVDAEYTGNGGIALDLVTYGDVVPIPEPATFSLLLLGGLWARKRRTLMY